MVWGYHNAQWADWKEEIGLMPPGTGAPGGSAPVSGQPLHRGRQAVRRRLPGLPGRLRRLLWGDRPVERNGSGGKRSKYVCPEDGIAAWARPGVRLFCGEHDGPPVPMRELVPSPV
jgi:hypothetical protein